MMENIRIRCRSCGKEVIGCAGKSVSCGCPNMASVIGDVVSAKDMEQVIMLNSYMPKILKVCIVQPNMRSVVCYKYLKVTYFGYTMCP